jgi:hypothetical protein
MSNEDRYDKERSKKNKRTARKKVSAANIIQGSPGKRKRRARVVSAAASETEARQ